MPAVVSLRSVVEELEMLSDEFHAYLNKETGEMVTITDEDIRAVEEEQNWDEYPEWQQADIALARKVLNNPDYLALPGRYDLDDYRTMEKFCYSIDNPRISSELTSLIQGSGAFRRFKDAIRRYDILDEWYQFRKESLEELAIFWLKENGITYTKSEEPASSSTQSD